MHSWVRNYSFPGERNTCKPRCIRCICLGSSTSWSAKGDGVLCQVGGRPLSDPMIVLCYLLHFQRRDRQLLCGRLVCEQPSCSWRKPVRCCPFCSREDKQPSCLEGWGSNTVNSQRDSLSLFLPLDFCCLDPCLGPCRARATLEVSSSFRTDELECVSGLSLSFSSNLWEGIG